MAVSTIPATGKQSGTITPICADIIHSQGLVVQIGSVMAVSFW